MEQKNGAVVRRTVGYRRFEGLEAAAVLARLYAAMRLFVNFFQPSFKLAAKARDGAKVTEALSSASHTLSAAVGGRRGRARRCGAAWNELRATLDPVRLLQQIRAAQQQLVDIADTPALGEAAKPTAPTLEQFLSGLRTAWQEGEVRPTSIAEGEAKALAASARSVRGGHDRAAGMVRGRAVAHIARTVRAAAGRVSRRLPGRAATNTASVA